MISTRRCFSALYAKLPKTVKIVEMGPRDGLQNEKTRVASEDKLHFIDLLGKSGLKAIESASFVSPKWVPQMGDAAEVMKGLKEKGIKSNGVGYPVLTPNVKGLKTAMECGVEEVAVFAAASESFTMKNTNCSISESLVRTKEICDVAIANKIKVRGYVSVVLGCPYEGAVDVDRVVNLARSLKDQGCYEISLGDTIGVGTPLHMAKLLEKLLIHIPVNEVAVHCHDTYGMAIANITTALQMGVNVVDSSVAGLGGCPYAPGALGNVATEDVVYLCEGMGIETGVDMTKLAIASKFICEKINRPNVSRVANALAAANKTCKTVSC